MNSILYCILDHRSISEVGQQEEEFVTTVRLLTISYLPNIQEQGCSEMHTSYISKTDVYNAFTHFLILVIYVAIVLGIIQEINVWKSVCTTSSLNQQPSSTSKWFDIHPTLYEFDTHIMWSDLYSNLYWNHNNTVILSKLITQITLSLNLSLIFHSSNPGKGSQMFSWNCAWMWGGKRGKYRMAEQGVLRWCNISGRDRHCW